MQWFKGIFRTVCRFNYCEALGSKWAAFCVSGASRRSRRLATVVESVQFVQKARGGWRIHRSVFGGSNVFQKGQIPVTCTNNHQQSPAINLSPASSPGGKYSASYLWSSNVITADDSVQCPWSSSAARACFFTANTKQGSTSHPDFWIMYSIQIFAWVGNILWSWDLVVSFSRYCIKITENQTSPLFSKRTSVCF